MEPFVLTFPSRVGLGPITFESSAELVSWLGEENRTVRAAFPTIQNAVDDPLNRSLNNAPRSLGHRTRATLESTTYLTQKLGADPEAEFAQQARNSLGNYFSGQALPSKSSLFQAAVSRADKGTDPDGLGYIFALLSQPPSNLSQIQGMFEGLAEGILGTDTITVSSQQVRASLLETEESRNLAATIVKDLNRLADSSQQSLVDAESNFTKGLEASLEDAQTTLNAYSQKVAVSLASGELDIRNFQAKIQTEIALQGPIAYWREKEKNHGRWFWGSLCAFVFLATGLSWIVWLEGKDLILEFQKRQDVLISEGHPELLKASAFDYLRFAFLTLITTLAIWLLRFIARILLSNLHLRDDAKERTTMINTFLALRETTDGLSESDTNLALGAVFRPATSGLVKDDGVPPGIYDAITRLKSGG